MNHVSLQFTKLIVPISLTALTGALLANSFLALIMDYLTGKIPNLFNIIVFLEGTFFFLVQGRGLSYFLVFLAAVSSLFIGSLIIFTKTGIGGGDLKHLIATSPFLLAINIGALIAFLAFLFSTLLIYLYLKNLVEVWKNKGLKRNITIFLGQLFLFLFLFAVKLFSLREVTMLFAFTAAAQCLAGKDKCKGKVKLSLTPFMLVSQVLLVVTWFTS